MSTCCAQTRGQPALTPADGLRSHPPCLLPRCLVQLAVFEGCGHMPQEECPERFVQEVQRFVDSQGP